MSVTGVVIAIALILALQIDKVRALGSPNTRSGLSIDEDPEHATLEKLQELENELMQLQEEVKKLHEAAIHTGTKEEIHNEIEQLEGRINYVTEVLAKQMAKQNGLAADPAAIVRIKILIKNLEQSAEMLGGITQENWASSKKLQDLEKDLRKKEAEIIRAKEKESNLVLIPELKKTSKEPVIIDVSAGKLIAHIFDTGKASKIDNFSKYCDRFETTDHYFVFFFRPSGAPRFDELRQVAADKGFEVGYDAIPEKAEIQWGNRPKK